MVKHDKTPKEMISTSKQQAKHSFASQNTHQTESNTDFILQF